MRILLFFVFIDFVCRSLEKVRRLLFFVFFLLLQDLLIFLLAESEELLYMGELLIFVLQGKVVGIVRLIKLFLIGIVSL